MVDKVVDMAVIHKITQLTDAVRTLGENEKEAVYCIKRLTEMVMDLDKRNKELEYEVKMQGQLIHGHLYTKIACSCPPCDAWGKEQDLTDAGWRYGED